MKPAKVKNSINHNQRYLISDENALIKGGEDELNSHYKISYKYYNNNFCEIDNLPTSPARKCLTKIKQLGQSNYKTLSKNNIRPRPVHNSGSYKTLFSGLSEDVKLYEIDLGDASRLFYFTVGSMLHIVAIKNSHIKC